MPTPVPARYFALFPTAIGDCGIAWEEGNPALIGVQLPESSPARALARLQRRFPQAQQVERPAGWVLPAVERITALLAGAPDDLCSLPLDMAGVPEFHQRVYALARGILPGQTLTYGEVARQLGEPGAARAVGQALGHNPFAPVVPCHRVLAANGRSGGFSADGGTLTKLRLLEIERADLGRKQGTPSLF